MKTINDITDSNINRSTFFFKMDNKNYVNLCIKNTFRNYVFNTSSKGDYIKYKGIRYYYPYTNNFIIR